MEAPPVAADAAALLHALGWGPFFADQADAATLAATPPARVTRVHRSGLHVLGAAGEAVLPPAEAITVGDWLLTGGDGPPRLLDRRSLIRRRAAGHDRAVQLIAANVDTAFVVTSCNRDFNVARLERYLALVFDAGADPVIVLTKPDLGDPAPFAAQARAIAAAVPVVTLDAVAGDVGAVLAPWCAPGRTVAFLGSSGVGKSTLTNALAGNRDIATGPVRAVDARGRHTTTRRELHLMPGGFAVLDTPGMRELQLTDGAGGIGAVFADLRDLAATCRFADCAHLVEPGCALLAAVAAGDLDPARLARWRDLAAEDARNTADLAERRRRNRAAGGKAAKGKRR